MFAYVYRSVVYLSLRRKPVRFSEVCDRGTYEVRLPKHLTRYSPTTSSHSISSPNFTVSPGPLSATIRISCPRNFLSQYKAPNHLFCDILYRRADENRPILPVEKIQGSHRKWWRVAIRKIDALQWKQQAYVLNDVRDYLFCLFEERMNISKQKGNNVQ